jgi:hypothetical protein
MEVIIMAKALLTLCDKGPGRPLRKHRSELDAKLAIVSMEASQNRGHKKKGKASKDIPKRAYFHDRDTGGCGYWHTTRIEGSQPLPK